MDLTEAFWRGKWVIILVTALFATSSIVVVLNMPNIYYSEATLMPTESESLQSPNSQLGGLASLAGINLNSESGSRHQIALEVLKSRKFVNNFVNKHDLSVYLMAATDYDLSSNTFVIDEKIYDSESKAWVREVKPPFTPEPNAAEIHSKFLEILVVESVPGSDVFTLGVEHLSPYEAKRWVDLLIEEINTETKQRDVIQAQNSIDYLQTELDKSQYESLRSLFFNLIEEQFKTIMLAKATPEYVFSVLDPPMVNLFKAGPPRSLIVIISSFLAGLITTIATIIVLTARVRKDAYS
jgi:uncharacterized protein involved in exopolysaccharide biosynthesis